MIEPTAALDEMVAQSIGPEYAMLMKLVSQLTGLAMDDDRLDRCCCSIVGQVLFYRHAHAVIVRLEVEKQDDNQRIEKLARHITDFSLAALAALHDRPTDDATAKKKKSTKHCKNNASKGIPKRGVQ